MDAYAFNAATLAALPISNDPYAILPGDTVACTKPKKLSRPSIYCDNGDTFQPVIGIVVEIVGTHLIAIHWDGYPAPWDYSQREVKGKIAVLSRAENGRIITRSRRTVGVACKDSHGWVTTTGGEFLGPLEILS